MLAIGLIVVLLVIFLGTKLGGIGIGFAGGLGVSILIAIGVKPSNVPSDVTPIIVAVITAISAMQVVGGLDYLIRQTEELLRRNPEYITILASIVTYFPTTFADTGSISLATLPVIAEVAKEQSVKPYRPLSTAMVPVQIAITALLVSAAMVYTSSVMEGHGISYLRLLSVIIPFTLLAVLATFFLVTVLFNSKLSDDPIYRKRLEGGPTELHDEKQIEIKSGAKTSVWLLLSGVVGVVIYAIINSPSMGLVGEPLMNTANAILIIMLSVATLTTVICKVDTDNILNSSTFRAGMSARIYILGVTQSGGTSVSNSIDWIKDTAGEVIQGHPWLLAIIFFFASVLLYSRATAAKVLISMALTPNVSPLTIITSSVMVSGLFILSTYPMLAVAVQMDDMGTTRIGKFVFNHSFFIPGTLGITLAVYFDFVLGSSMLQRPITGRLYPALFPTD